jgi:transaldolase
MTKLHMLKNIGQSSWLNYMCRPFIVSGGLRESIEQGIVGITASAPVFENTIRNDEAYDQDIRKQVMAGTPTTRIHEVLMADDVQRASDLLHPIFEDSKGLDGVASLEINPALADDCVGIVATARRLLARVDRGNAMVEVPATLACTEAVRALTVDGINVNITHIFSVSVYERIAQAYITGLENYFKTHSVWRTTPTSVASFSISPIDRVVDEQLEAIGRSEYKGKTGLAMARVLYARFQDIFSGPRWAALAARGARPLRPKWTRLEAREDARPLTEYVDSLIGPDTVVTFSPALLDLFLEQGRIATTLERGSDTAQKHLALIADLGIDLEALTADLQKAYLEAADKQYQALIASVIQKLVSEVPGYS